MRVQWLGMGVVGIASLTLNGCGKTRYTELSEKPALHATAAIPTTAQSLVTLNALFPYDMIATALTDALPASTPLEGRQNVCMNVTEQVQQHVQRQIGGDIGKLFGEVAKFVTDVVTVGQVRNACLDVDYRATIVRSGPVTVTPMATGLRLAVPVSVEGSAGFAGDLAQFFKLDKKNFRGAIVASADIEMAINEDWCPVIKVEPNFTWVNNAELEVIGKFWINIDSEAGPKIKDAMRDAAGRMPDLISCQRVKQLVAPMWRAYQIAFPPIMGQKGLVTITPQRVGFSGFSYTPAGAQLALMLTADTQLTLDTDEVGTTSAVAMPEASAQLLEQRTVPAVASNGRVGKVESAASKPAMAVQKTALELPKLETIPVQQNSLNLAVPIHISYNSLNQLIATKAVGRTFSGSAAGTSASIKILKTEVYPSGDRLIVGVQFESKVTQPKSIAPQGWVYLIAKPTFDVATQTLRLREVEFSRAIDNDVWNALSFLFQSQIRAAITAGAAFDLRPGIVTTRAALHRQLREVVAKDGINIGLNDEFVGLTGLAMVQDGIQVVIGLRGSANIIVLNRPVT